MLIKDVGHKITARGHPRPAGDQGPRRRHGAVLRPVPRRCCRTSSTPTTPATSERYQSPEDRERFDDTTKCILCAACTTSCPIYWGNDTYVGPAAIVNAHRFIFDSRDEGSAERLDILNEKSGVWRCRTAFNCSEACPRGIKVTQAIEEVKRAILLDRV